MTVFIILIIAIIVVAVIWLLMQPAQYEVVRSRVIQASPETVYGNVVDFKQWAHWSPWLLHEPEASLQLSPKSDAKGSWYQWQGQFIGSGKMTHRQLVEQQSIEQVLELQTPMKSSSEVYWRFTSVAEGTEVTWGMRGKMPFLFRWMSKMMDQWMGKDYEIGLLKLAMLSGDMQQPLEIEFNGTVEVEPEHYIASHFVGSIDDMKQAMQTAYPKVMQAAEKHEMEISGTPLAIYHDFDMKTNRVICDIAIPVKQPKVVTDLITGSLVTERYMRTTLRGDYVHLERAWHSALSHARMSKQKVQVGRPMLERYVSNPMEKQGLELVTMIDLPLKS